MGANSMHRAEGLHALLSSVPQGTRLELSSGIRDRIWLLHVFYRYTCGVSSRWLHFWLFQLTTLHHYWHLRFQGVQRCTLSAEGLGGIRDPVFDFGFGAYVSCWQGCLSLLIFEQFS